MAMCRQGTSVKEAKVLQPSRIDHEDLPWPLTVPWSGSFLVSSNANRDFISQGIFGVIEEELVRSYRADMLKQYPEIAELRQEISQIFSDHLPAATAFIFPDGIEDVLNDKVKYQEASSVLLQERLLASHSLYKSQLEEIIKFCGKQNVMLANPAGNQDSPEVRLAFKQFIEVS